MTHIISNFEQLLYRTECHLAQEVLLKWSALYFIHHSMHFINEIESINLLFAAYNFLLKRNFFLLPRTFLIDHSLHFIFHNMQFFSEHTFLFCRIHFKFITAYILFFIAVVAVIGCGTCESSVIAIYL